MQWRLLLKEYGPKFMYKKGSENVVADVLSWVPTFDENMVPAIPEMQCVKVDDLWTECLWAMPKFDEQNCHPFQFDTLQHYQSKDNELLQLPALQPEQFLFHKYGNIKLVCQKADDGNYGIALTDAMLPKIVS